MAPHTRQSTQPASPPSGRSSAGTGTTSVSQGTVLGLPA